MRLSENTTKWKGIRMRKNIEEQMNDILDDIENLDSEFPDKEIIDLKLKYVIAETLNNINLQLFEISHYGIGTD